MTSPASPPQRWYQGVTRYQWLVLIVASLGWIFDAFEGQRGLGRCPNNRA